MLQGVSSQAQRWPYQVKSTVFKQYNFVIKIVFSAILREKKPFKCVFLLMQNFLAIPVPQLLIISMPKKLLSSYTRFSFFLNF